jgi:hypothetical protein
MPARNEDLHGNAPDKARVALILIDVINDLDFPEGDQLLRSVAWSRATAGHEAPTLDELRGRAMEVHGGPVEGVEWGNAGQVETGGTHWIVGFSDALRASPLRFNPRDQAASEVCVKWRTHPAGDTEGKNKPLSTGRTLSVLVNEGGRFVLRFRRAGGASTTVVLDTPGDFAVWGEGISHEWEVSAPATVMTVRWKPVG